MAHCSEGLGPADNRGDDADGGGEQNTNPEETPEDNFIAKLSKWQKGQNTITLAISVLKDLQLRQLAHMNLT